MIDFVLRQYSRSLQADTVESLANAGGFSGAQLWRAKAGTEHYCVRRWPKLHPTVEHLQWIHSVLRHAAERCKFIPQPILNNAQQTIVSHGGYLWEVTPWMPGVADLSTNCTEVKVQAAFQSLAEFHLAVEPANAIEKPSEGIRKRLEFAERLIDELPELASRTKHSSLDDHTLRLCNDIVEMAPQKLLRLPNLFKPVVGKLLPHQPCIRDIWYQHVLFQENRVSGIIDFGAMRVETVALDLARLLGSLPDQGRDLQSVALEAYTRIRRPLSQIEQQSMAATLEAATALSALTWVCWLVIDKRTFENMDQVQRRLEQLRTQLQAQA